MTLLNVSGLRSEFRGRDGWLEAVSGVDFELRKGEVLGLVGESGCGKSTVAYSLMGLLPPNARISGGSVSYGGQDLTKLSQAQLRPLRGARLGMIFQNPMTALDPVYRIGRQLEEVLQEHLGLDRAAARQRAVDLLRSVAIPSPEARMRAYPHELSGGMRQRVALAIAIACNPEVLIADEPTTALDVTIQAQLLQLIRELLVVQQGAGVLLITHDLGVVARTCDRVAVMYAGRIVETASVEALFANPMHPYTRALLAAAPGAGVPRGALSTIPGRVPGLEDRGAGCMFRDRCPASRPACAAPGQPTVANPEPGREVACVQYA